MSVGNLGHTILSVPAHHVHTMQEFRKPVNKKDLRAFLGSIGYYCKFINNFAKHSFLLILATSFKALGKVHWTPGMAFSQLKVCLCDHVVLNVSLPEDQLTLRTVEVLELFRMYIGMEKRSQPPSLADNSRVQSTSTRQQNWKHWLLSDLFIISCHIYSRKFEVVTDHIALTSLVSSRTLN